MINLKSEAFSDSAKVYFWECNIGGQLTNNGEHVLDIKAGIQKKNSYYLKDVLLKSLLNILHIEVIGTNIKTMTIIMMFG